MGPNIPPKLSNGTFSPCRKRRKLDSCYDSKTCEKLLNMVGRGRISVAGAVDLASSMIDDGMVQDAIQRFASLGCQNQYPANTERDLHRSIKGLFGFQLEPYTVWMNLQVAHQ